MNNLLDRLKALRAGTGITQKALAETLHIAERAYQYYEAGKREPTMSVLVALADFFDVSLDYLVGRSDDPRRLP